MTKKDSQPNEIIEIIENWLSELGFDEYREEYEEIFSQSVSEIDKQILLRLDFQLRRLTNRFAYHVETTMNYAEYKLSNEHTYRQSTKFNDDSEAFMYEPGVSDMELMDALRDGIESFHEQVYKVISSMWLMCSKLESTPFKMLPTARAGKGNKKFLDWLIGPEAKKMKFSSSFYKSIQTIEESRKFRSEHLEHLDDPSHIFSMTQNLDKDFFVIYYEPSDPDNPYQFKSGEIKSLHPDHFNYEPPVECKNFIVSPEITKTFRAVLLVCKELMRRLNRRTK